MGNSEFRYKRFGQYLGLVFLGPFIAFLLSFLIPLLDIRGLIDRIPVADYPSIWGVAGFIIMASLTLFEIWLFIGMVIFGITYKLTITETDLIITGWDFWGRKLLNQMNHGYYLGKIPYESIVSISLDSWKPGIIKFSFSDESYIILPSRALENHTEFIDQLSEKLANTQVGDVLAKLKRPKRFKILQTLIYSLAFAPTIFLLFFMLVERYEPHVWNEEFTHWSVGAISPDSNGTVWVNARNFHKGDFYIWRISKSNREHWTLPKEICDKCNLFTISHDANGFPKVVEIERGTSAIYAWNGDTWERTTVEADFFNENLNAIDTKPVGAKLSSSSITGNGCEPNYTRTSLSA